MSNVQDFIQSYYKERENLSSSVTNPDEGQLRPLMGTLLRSLSSSKHLILIDELSEKKNTHTIRPDGFIKNKYDFVVACWESKDPKDNLDEEIQKKLGKEYPTENILFEDSQVAVLYQNNKEVMREDIADPVRFDKLLTAFISYQPKEVLEFNNALEDFKHSVPSLAVVVKADFEKATKDNPTFIAQLKEFKKICQSSIREDISDEDIKEMVVQHILTMDVFNVVFEEGGFSQNNTIAMGMANLVKSLGVDVQNKVREKMRAYYNLLSSRAKQVSNTSKQEFLNVIYEDFLKAYNPKSADKLGVVYTPSEVVNFMVKSSDELLKRHFGKQMKDRGVEILDPATGTGTFVTAILEHIAQTGTKAELKHKYAQEIHANELSILPYYIANLNIEHTYHEKTGDYALFENICFVDTLEHTLGNVDKKQQGSLFTVSISDENTKRVNRQNERPISLVIGNPPYNANQQNENDNNKNREYPHIDDRIKETYIKESNAQKTKTYDMYTRFYRWAMDRVQEDGVIAYITNRSFIDAKGYDGFRKHVRDHFNYAYIVDLGGDIRANNTGKGIGNVFNIMTGVAMMFLVKEKNNKKPCDIRYYALDDFMRREDKLKRLYQTQSIFNKSLYLEPIEPDAKNNWLNQTDNDWDTLVPVASEQTKKAKTVGEHNALFKLYSNGVATNRDEWVYDFKEDTLRRKVKFFIETFNANLKEKDWDYNIKWSEALKNHKNTMTDKDTLKYQPKLNIPSLYRPFIRKHYYSEYVMSDRLTGNHYSMFGESLDLPNVVIGTSPRPNFSALSMKYLCDLHFNGDTQAIPLYTYSNGKQESNLTAFGLRTFQNRYPQANVTAERVFAYVYAVFHHTPYRTKYATNLKQDLPRVPLYNNFEAFADIGQQLLNTHTQFENLPPHKNIVIKTVAQKKDPKPSLKQKGDIVEIDENTHLHGVPESAYKVGNRSPIAWVLDQYKEKKPSDPTIEAKFNDYCLADHKDHVIELICKLATLSEQTDALVAKLDALKG